ncbi:hypothetical protein ABPG73_011453 [Tetrahymena malaccensis]
MRLLKIKQDTLGYQTLILDTKQALFVLYIYIYSFQGTSQQYDIYAQNDQCNQVSYRSVESNILRNDVAFDFYGAPGQMTTIAQASYDQYYYILKDNVQQYPSQFIFSSFWFNNNLAKNVANYTPDNSQASTCDNTFYKSPQYQKFYMTIATDSLTFSASINPPSMLNQLSNIEFMVYYQCPVGCNTCDDNQCFTCVDNYKLINLKCYYQLCKSNQYVQIDPNSTEQSCQQCDVSCQTCFGVSKSCIVCNSGFYPLISGSGQNTFNCYQQCPDSYYLSLNSQCLKCDLSCQTCSNDLKSCKICAIGFYPQIKDQLQTTFNCYQNCPDGYYLIQNKCQKCDNSCLTCKNDPKNCIACASNFYPLIITQQQNTYNCYQNCPDGYYLNNNQCQICDQSCSTCVNSSKNCKQCAQDYFPIYITSSTTFACYWTCPNGYQLTNLSCSQIFDSSTLSLLTSHSVCSINKTQIIVSLSNDATIMVNSTIHFNKSINSLSFQAYNTPIDTYYLVSVVQDQINEPLVNIQYLDVVNSCDDMSFRIKVQNDALRGFLYISWNFISPKDLSSITLSQINKIIQDANNQQQTNLVISKYILPPDISFTFQFNYILKVYKSNQIPFTVFNQKSKQIVIQSDQSRYDPIYRYMNLTVIFQFLIQICDQQGVQFIKEPLDITIISNAIPSLNQQINQFNNEEVQIDILAYQIPLGTTLDLKVQSFLNSNKAVGNSQSLAITPQISDLVIEIADGQQRLVSYKTQMNISDQIGNLLNNITIPNQGQLELQGNFISLTTQQITSKNLQKYYNSQNNELPNDSNIFNVVMTQYSQNPYIQSKGFQNYTNQLKNATPDIQISLNPVIKPFIQGYMNSSIQDQKYKLEMQFQNIKKSNYNYTCIQQQDEYGSLATIIPQSQLIIDNQQGQNSDQEQNQVSPLQKNINQQLNCQQYQQKDIFLNQNNQNQGQNNQELNNQIRQEQMQKQQQQQQDQLKLPNEQQEMNQFYDEQSLILINTEKQITNKNNLDFFQQKNNQQKEQKFITQQFKTQKQDNKLEIIYYQQQIKSDQLNEKNEIDYKNSIFQSEQKLQIGEKPSQTNCQTIENILLSEKAKSVQVIQEKSEIEDKEKEKNSQTQNTENNLNSPKIDELASVISGQDEGYSNAKIAFFFIIFGLDFLVSMTLVSLFHITILYQFFKNNQNKLLIKIFKLLSIQEILQNVVI